MTQFEYTNKLIALITTIELANDKGDYEAVKDMTKELKKVMNKMAKDLNTDDFVQAMEMVRFITSVS